MQQAGKATFSFPSTEVADCSLKSLLKVDGRVAINKNLSLLKHKRP
jgi:hypothetical protein